MSPFGADEKAISRLPADVQVVVTQYLEHASARYFRMRNALIVFCCLVVFGVVLGFYSVSHLAREQHDQAIQRTKDVQTEFAINCWSSFNGRIALRALVAETGNTPPPKVADPQLQALINKSVQEEKQFKAFAFKILPVPVCKGSNPDPVPQKTLNLAGVPNVKQMNAK